MGLRNLALAALATLIMAGCVAGRYTQTSRNAGRSGYGLSVKEYTENDIEMPRFRNALDMKENLKRSEVGEKIQLLFVLIVFIWAGKEFLTALNLII